MNSQSSRKSGETEKEGEEGREKGGRGSEGERQGERESCFSKKCFIVLRQFGLDEIHLLASSQALP